MSKREGFFRIFKSNIDLLTDCEADALTVCAYLVVACGTRGDNQTSTWSAEAVRKYAGCRPGTAKERIERLIELGLITLNDEKSKQGRPIYTLRQGTGPDDVELWLPNALITGPEGAKAPYPAALLREGGDPLRLRLLLDLYAGQSLLNHGGVDPSLIRACVPGEVIGQKNGANVWLFESGSYEADPRLYQPHGGEEKAPPEFWDRFNALRSLGFIEEVFVLSESEEGEPLFAKGTSDEEVTHYRLLAEHAKKLAGRNPEKGWVFPVPQHIKHPSLEVILRMKHRPHTKVTAAWWGLLQEQNEAYVRRFGLLQNVTAVAKNPFADNPF